MKNYTEKTLRKKAIKAGFRIEKGFCHWMTEGYPVYTYYNGERDTGYNLIDESTNTLVWGCHDGHVDHLFTLDDIAEFLEDVYTSNGLTF